MDGIEQLIMVMRKEGGRGYTEPFALGEMQSESKCRIKGTDFEGEELYFSGRLRAHDAAVVFPGEDGEQKIILKEMLMKGDMVVCCRLGERYVILDKVVSG